MRCTIDRKWLKALFVFHDVSNKELKRFQLGFFTAVNRIAVNSCFLAFGTACCFFEKLRLTAFLEFGHFSVVFFKVLGDNFLFFVFKPKETLSEYVSSMFSEIFLQKNHAMRHQACLEVCNNLLSFGLDPSLIFYQVDFTSGFAQTIQST
jgi:hypothetical protein